MDFRAILTELSRADVEYVVIDGMSAVLQGVPATTFDLDIVHARDAENRGRLLEVLRRLEASYREHLPRILAPTESDLDSDGHMLLMTSAGPLDILGTVVGGRRYEDLVTSSRSIEIGDGVQVKLLDLEMLIVLKEEMGREKDLAHLPLLRSALDERRTL